VNKVDNLSAICEPIVQTRVDQPKDFASLGKRKAAKKSSEAESFKHMNIKYPTHLEDGQVGRNM
jgi:hypothetical protein